MPLIIWKIIFLCNCLFLFFWYNIIFYFWTRLLTKHLRSPGKEKIGLVRNWLSPHVPIWKIQLNSSILKPTCTSIYKEFKTSHIIVLCCLSLCLSLTCCMPTLLYLKKFLRIRLLYFTWRNFFEWDYLEWWSEGQYIFWPFWLWSFQSYGP